MIPLSVDLLMAIMGYKNLSKLSKDIQERIKRLEYGELSEAELESLVQDSRDGSERLLVLRYKFHDVRTKQEEKNESLKGEIPVHFKMEAKEEIKPDVSPNQVSLIDAIEDVQSEQKVELPQQQALDLDEPIEPRDKEEVVEEELEELEELGELEESENGNGLVEEDASLVEVHEKAPIANLKKEISLNLKFRFINELFKGDSDAYNAFIDGLDEQKNKKAADKLVESDGRSKFEWEAESEEVELFLELVERRFM